MKIKEFIIIPSSIDAMGLIHKPGTGPNNRFGFKNVGNNRGNETKEAPPGTYFTKTGNLVKGRLTKAAKEKGARETDPKDKQRSKVPPVTQTNEEEHGVDLKIPTGKKMILQADDEKHTRGLVITSNEDGSYDSYYWYDNPMEPLPIEIKIDGETVTKDAKNVNWQYHPELEYETRAERLNKIIDEVKSLHKDKLLTREDSIRIKEKLEQLSMVTEIYNNKKIVESLYSLDREDIMNSEVLVQGVGRYTISTLMKDVAGKLKDLSDEASKNNPDNFKNIKTRLDSGILQLMVSSLNQTFQDIENIRRKGGKASAGIPRNVFDSFGESLRKRWHKKLVKKAIGK